MAERGTEVSRPLIANALAGAVIVLVAALFLTSPALSCSQVTASWYGLESCANPRDCRTADGNKFNPSAMTTAHRTLPFGTKLRVTYRGKSVTVRVNDRGPFIKGRTLDLSKGAAAKLGMLRAGTAKVCMEKL